MNQIRAFIVDDEPLARDWLRHLLAEEPGVTLVGEAGDGREAVAKLQAVKPDLLFLDVQMPELDGFDVLRALDPDSLPVVVFVTAYDQHALKAFDVHALDYILKPFERDRFRLAMERARELLAPRGGEAEARRLIGLLESLQAKAGTLERVAVKTDGVIKLVRLADVDFIEAAGRYVTLHVGKEQHLLRETMNDLEAQLDASVFARVHRSAIVNLDRIKELQTESHGEVTVVLEGGRTLRWSRSYRERLEALLGSAGAGG
ncbi:MAG TPA: LytTR family DNA-binding domain-containing protein [Thermoanaerobaculia bacterium]